ncbi:MAG: hypothetical protein GX967_02690 [Clostridiales bacterium]|nr:hypothetical protein [Clostridiales bacterium]
MSIFYAITFIIGISLTGILIAVRYVYGEEVFDKFHRAGIKLPRYKGSARYIIPNDPVYLPMTVCFFGVIGWLFDFTLDVPAMFSLPSALIGAIAISIMIYYPKRERMSLKRIREEDLFDLEAIVIEDIEADGYGRIEVDYGGINHVVNAVCADEKQIPKGEKVKILLCVDELYFCTPKEESVGRIHESANI